MILRKAASDKKHDMNQIRGREETVDDGGGRLLARSDTSLGVRIYCEEPSPSVTKFGPDVSRCSPGDNDVVGCKRQLITTRRTAGREGGGISRRYHRLETPHRTPHRDNRSDINNESGVQLTGPDKNTSVTGYEGAQNELITSFPHLRYLDYNLCIKSNAVTDSTAGICPDEESTSVRRDLNTSAMKELFTSFRHQRQPDYKISNQTKRCQPFP
ncbi:hypothetical protein J6590_056881 [Homalodisca vitripennis]|nr:hypothetical protein J6590_056881 [Homalodisca vitripennis]